MASSRFVFPWAFPTHECDPLRWELQPGVSQVPKAGENQPIQSHLDSIIVGAVMAPAAGPPVPCVAETTGPAARETSFARTTDHVHCLKGVKADRWPVP